MDYFTKQKKQRKNNNEKSFKDSWLDKLQSGLQLTNNYITSGLRKVFSKKHLIEDRILNEIELLLIRSNCGYTATQHILDQLKIRSPAGEAISLEKIQLLLIDIIYEILLPLESPFTYTPSDKPTLILFSGVNGAGKTTTIGKLAQLFKKSGHSVIIAAGDTFRAAANEQLKAWATHADVPIIQQEKGEPASVIYDAVHAACSRKTNIVLADTAGRLSTQHNLMNELAKIHRVVQKIIPDHPYEKWLVIDAPSGQNAISQLEAFNEISTLTGLVISKLDGSGKGGILLAIANSCPIPIRFITFGEKDDDIAPFSARYFAESLLHDNKIHLLSTDEK